MLRADGLVYQDVEDLLEVGKALNPSIKTFDAACFDGHYVTGEAAAAVVVPEEVPWPRALGHQAWKETQW